MSFFNEDELADLGLASYGDNVQISRLCSMHSIGLINIGSNVRIDDFCILSAGAGGIFIGNYVHIACYSSVIGKGRVTFEDYTCISARVSIYSSSDDYSGNTMSNSTVPEQFKNVTHGPVILKKHTLVGCGTVVLPNVTLGTGCSVGALSLVNSNCDEFGVYMGVPAKKVKNRSRNMLILEKELLKGA